jgi:hypothetical protein
VVTLLYKGGLPWCDKGGKDYFIDYLGFELVVVLFLPPPPQAEMLCLAALLAAAPLCLGAPTRPAPATRFLGSGDASAAQFDLLSVSLNASALTVDTAVLLTVPGWVMVQGDATAFDPATGTYFVTLNNASKAGSAMYWYSSLFALSVAAPASVLWRHDFAPNVTMGALAWEPSSRQLVGLCGSLLLDLRVSSFCALDPAAPSAPPRVLNDFSEIGHNVSYDPDTRALDPAGQAYYHRLYTASGGAWMPDNIVTLSSTNGSILNAVYGGGPEYAGTAFDRASGQLWSGSNAPGGIDLCLVDPATGATLPTGAWVQKEGSGTSMIYAATAALDGQGAWSFVTAAFASVPGTRLVAVDISNKDYTTDRISYLYTFRNPAVGLLAGLHLWNGEDQPPPLSVVPARTGHH